MASTDQLSVITMDLGVKQPLTTEFLLVFGDQEKPCASFYGKEDKKKVREVLQQEIHPEVHAKWGDMKCHCQLISKIQLSKTAKNLNKVFLTCGGSAIESCCNFFSGSTHHCIPCQVIQCQTGFEKNKLTRNLANQNLSNPTTKRVEHCCSKQSKMYSSGKSNKLNKPGSISLLKAPVSKTNDGKPRKRPPCYQVPFIEVPRLPKYIRKQMRGKTSKPWATTSFKHIEIVRNMLSGNHRWGQNHLRRTNPLETYLLVMQV